MARSDSYLLITTVSQGVGERFSHVFSPASASEVLFTIL
jgi:hypothetical protein